MFFWKKQSEAEKQAEARQKASIAALERGDIPLLARTRLEEHVARGDKFFSSDLNCREFLFARQAGYEPVSQVMGTAFVNISFFGGLRTARATGEVKAVTDAQLRARTLAITRMQKEAELLKADGIVGVRLVMKNYDWSQRQVEFTAIGTAIRIPGRSAMSGHAAPHDAGSGDAGRGDAGRGDALASPSSLPFTCALSGQEFWQLHQAGYWPRGICLGVCSYYVYTDPETRKTLYNWWGTSNSSNAEVKAYTQGFYDARERALSRLITDIAEHQGEGVVGMKVDQDIEDVEYEINDRTYHDFLIHFNLMGTSIIKDPLAKPVEKRSTLVMIDLASKSTRNLELTSRSIDTFGSEDETDDDNEDFAE